MASSGKKGKKSKGTVVSLQSFLSNGNATPIGITQVAKNVRNLDGDDSDDGGNVHTVVCQLPTAPRASRLFDEDLVPHKGPFIAYINNLPFDINEDDIYDYFNNNNIVSIRLPRDDGDTGRVRGFGYVEFKNRNDLIDALGLPDPSLKGRRIRIELSNENDQNQRQRGRRGFDTSSNSENRESTNWRRDTMEKRGGGGGGGGGGFERRNEKYDRNDRSDRNDRNESRNEEATPGSWRMGGGRSSANEGGPSERRYPPRDFQQRDNRDNRDDPPQERPKLNLKPRTLPLPEEVIAPIDKIEKKEEAPTSAVSAAPKPSGVSAEKVFGSAKPVDTTAKELEIEERLAEMRRKAKELESAEKAVSEIKIEIKEPAAAAESNWRKQQPNEEGKSTRSDQRRDNNRDDRRRNQDRVERSDNRDKPRDARQRDGHSKDNNKQRDSNKAAVRVTPKTSPKQCETALVSSNKYSGLLDEDASD